MKKWLVILLLLIAACSSGSIVEFPNGAAVKVELAVTPEQQMNGLMQREFLEEDSGMLFVKETEQNMGFWMKNTLIPLDIIFINKEWEVVDIKHSFEPCKVEQCPIYKSKKKAKYALEVNSGFAEEQGLEIGDKLEINI